MLTLTVSAILGCAGGPPAGPNGQPTQPPAGGALSTRLPAQLGGQPMVYVDATGDQAATLLETADAGLLTESMDAINSPMSSLDVAIGIHPSIVVGALSVEGLHWTPASSRLARLVASLVGPVQRLHVSSPTIAGKRVLRIIDREDPDYLAWAYIATGRDTDVVYFARGDDSLLEEFFGSVR